MKKTNLGIQRITDWHWQTRLSNARTWAHGIKTEEKDWFIL